LRRKNDLQMIYVLKTEALKELLAEQRSEGKTIGFVPTMGALHKGHLSLIRRSKEENDVTVVSIFVNPTQFNNPEDLRNYPRNLEKDGAKLLRAECDFVFVPSVEEMYPRPDKRVFKLGHVAEVMEGAFRPGHFNGVAQIVSKLFCIVEPDNAYFGEKDFQQIAVVRAMVKSLSMKVNIVACPIVRDTGGLAMSSRNALLSEDMLKIASVIYRTLKRSRILAKRKSVNEVKDWVVTNINNTPPLHVEYFEIIDSETLMPVTDWEQTEEPRGCIAVYCGRIRLIDNIKY